MHEKSDHEALKNEIERGLFVRAVLLAEHMGLPEGEIKVLRHKALGKMSAIHRNPQGTRHIARQYGLSREEVRKILEEFADEMKNGGNNKPLEPCYDYSTGKYLSFEKWMDHYLKIWDKIAG
jgi:DNA-directed RNA polymerase sigma subunit (sigma70/sigma32)